MVFLCITVIIISISVYLFTKKVIYIVFIVLILFGSIYINILDIDYDTRYSKVKEEVKIRAIIVNDSEEKEYKYTYTIKVKSINGDDRYDNSKLILNVKKSNELKQIPKFGDEIEILGKVEKPSGVRNYKGFDYKQYLKSKKIYGTVEVKNVDIIGSNKTGTVDRVLNLVQNSIKSNFNKVLDVDTSALCIGILVGARTDISEEIETSFKTSNLTHLLAVSGSHITYIITAFAFVLSKSSKKFIRIFTIIFLIFFMALTGYTASVVRATIMGIIMLLASLLYRKSDTINNLGISSFIILLSNPYAIIDLGFLLSYSGTIGIILLGNIIMEKMYKLLNFICKGRINLQRDSEIIHESCSNIAKEFSYEKKNDKINRESKIKKIIIKYIIDSFSITISANIIIIPIMAYFFSTTSFMFWISNILAGPIMEIVTIFGFVVYLISIICMPLAKFLGFFLNILLTILIKIAEYSSQIPGSSFYIKTPYLFECVLYYLIIYILLNQNKIKVFLKNNMYVNKIIYNNKFLMSKNLNSIDDFFVVVKKIKHKIISVLIIISMLFSFIYNSFPKSLKIYFVDVGQGDCTLIKTPTNKNILIDGGGSEFGSFDVGEKILLPYLLDRRVTRVDYLFISHFDSDHIGGLFKIMENVKIKNIIISKQGKESENLKEFKEIVSKKRVNVKVVKKGDLIKVDKYSYFEILFPEENLIEDNILNNNSIVTKFSCMGLNILFTGDIEEIAEKRLIELYGNNKKLKSTILKVAHHGSKSSSIDRFLELVQPKIALIGVGEDNNFGHPNQGVLDRIGEYTNMIYRTDINGEIEIIYSNGKIKIKTIY